MSSEVCEWYQAKDKGLRYSSFAITGFLILTCLLYLIFIIFKVDVLGPIMGFPLFMATIISIILTRLYKSSYPKHPHF